VALIAPANGTSSAVNAYNFTFNVSDFSEITSCVLIFNSSVINNITTVYRDAENNFSNSSLPIGVFNWSVNCTDVVGFTANSGNFALAITEVPPSPSTSGGGGKASRSFYSMIQKKKLAAARQEQTAVLEESSSEVSEQASETKPPAAISVSAVSDRQELPNEAVLHKKKTSTGDSVMALLFAVIIAVSIIMAHKKYSKPKKFQFYP
jgi:hypothetical protein